MVLFSVCRKNLISSLRGEYVDFIVSRFTFTIFTIATALVLYRLKGNQVSSVFMQSTGHSDYLGFIVIGTALYGTTHGILLNVSRTLMTERREGTLEAVLLIPFSRWKYYGGNQLHQLMLTGLDFVLAVLLASLLGVRFQYNFPGVCAALIQLFLTLYGLALLISLLMISLKDTFFIQNTIIPIILLIGGFLFPVEVLPVPFRILSEIIPVYKGVHMVRESVLLGKSVPLDMVYFYSLIPGVLFLILGFILLPTIERKALEEYLS
jgi:ABC-2 type transport system permease protein